MPVETSKCPWCGNTVPQVKFIEIEGRIRAEEKKKLALVESNLRQQYEEQTKLQVQQETKKAAEKERKAAEQWAKEQTSKLQVERDGALQKMKASEAREATLRKQLTEEAERNLKKEILKERKAGEARASEQTRKLQTERDGAIQKLKGSEARESALKKQMAEEAARTTKKELDSQRQILERDRDQRERKLRAEYVRKLEGAEKKVGLLQRQLQEKTANELGDGAEIDLFEELRNLFPADDIKRIPKGRPGADIHHEVYYKGQSCGKIVYDSKNRRDWKDEYASKLRSDQTEAGAEHAILSTNVFPRGEKELCLRDDIIVVSPARVGYLVQLLRARLLDMHIRNLSVKERTGKMAQLYQLIASPAFKQRLREVDRLSDELLEVDVEEGRAHQNVWKKRGLLMKRLKNMTSEIDTEISAIIERTDLGEIPARPVALISQPTSKNVLRPKAFPRN
ncbi:MAG: DUF2130 domain-containing protein [Pyrinomonadaceae bacterium]